MAAVRKHFPALIVLLLLTMIAARGLIEIGWLLPSPVGDSPFFVTASANYSCFGFFGTTAMPIRPPGESRMTWHGFVSPLFYGAVNPTCHASVFYATWWLLRALTFALIVLLGRFRNYSTLVTFGLATFVLAAQSDFGFRPEVFALLLIVLSELAITRKSPLGLGAGMGALLCTQPTLAGLYGLVILLTRTELVGQWLRIGIGYITAVALLLAWYPFPIADLIKGLAYQAKVIVGRSDGSLWAHYIASPFFPLWGLLLVCSLVICIRRRPLLALALLPLWFFGPRVPPLSYNLIPICFVLVLLSIEWSSQRIGQRLGAACLIIGASGLALLTARDVLTIIEYGDTFHETAGLVADIGGQGISIGEAPPFLTLTNPELKFTMPKSLPAVPAAAVTPTVDLYAVNGRPIAPCADGISPPSVWLTLASVKVFQSNSGWLVYRCHRT
jgi:hypothetical protein